MYTNYYDIVGMQFKEQLSYKYVGRAEKYHKFIRLLKYRVVLRRIQVLCNNILLSVAIIN